MNHRPIRLGVNIDHVATLRQVRGVNYPDPIQAAFVAIKAGADGITLHLREDRRHIQDEDVVRLKETLNVPMNLEMAVTDEMIDIALRTSPRYVCFVPEKREELTTEGGLDVLSHFESIAKASARLKMEGIQVSLFIDPDIAQIEAAKKTGAPIIELHTGAYANALNHSQQQALLDKLKYAANYASRLGLIVNAGHGLHMENVREIAEISVIHELNIGHSIIARAVFVGLEHAVMEIKNVLLSVRQAEIAV